MADPFVGEIRMFACNFAPVGWAFCNGQLMPISSNTALFSLLGTNYGGDGKSTFGLPNFTASVPVHQGQAQSGSYYNVGQREGESAVMLTTSQVPAHTHNLQAVAREATLDNPSPQNALARSTPGYIYKQPAGAGTPVPLAPGVLNPAGGNQPHNNLMPYLTLNFCIALQGIYPPRS